MTAPRPLAAEDALFGAYSLDVECPHCGAAPTWPCAVVPRSQGQAWEYPGNRRPHAARLDAAARAKAAGGEK